jgi:hypothetical protein
MLDRALWQKLLRLPFNPSLKWWPHKIIEKECPIDEQRKTGDLQPFECLPPKTKRYDPDEKGAACVDCRTRSCGDGSGH